MRFKCMRQSFAHTDFAHLINFWLSLLMFSMLIWYSSPSRLSHHHHHTIEQWKNRTPTIHTKVNQSFSKMNASLLRMEQKRTNEWTRKRSYTSSSSSSFALHNFLQLLRTQCTLHTKSNALWETFAFHQMITFAVVLKQQCTMWTERRSWCAKCEWNEFFFDDTFELSLGLVKISGRSFLQ